jgi:hypothetical protein
MLCVLESGAVGGGGKGGDYSVSRGEEEGISGFLAGSVLASSAQTYKPGWARWLEYLATLGPGSHPGEAMQRAEGPYAKAQRLVLYYRHLFCEGKRGEQIIAASSALRYHLGVRGVDTDFFDSPLAVIGRKSGKRSVKDKRTREESSKRTSILPLGLEAVLQMRGELWSASDWRSAGSLDQRALWIAIGLGFNGGDRISNLSAPDRKTASDHCLLARHVTLKVEEMEGGVLSSVTGGAEFNRFHQRSKGYRVRRLTLHFYSTKKASGVVELVSDDPGDAILVEDVAEWLRSSGVGSEDYLTDRYFLGRRKSVTANAVRSAIKSFCASRGLFPRVSLPNRCATGLLPTTRSVGAMRRSETPGGYGRRGLLPLRGITHTGGPGGRSPWTPPRARGSHRGTWRG